MPRIDSGSADINAMIDTIRFSEHGADLLKNSDDGYDVIVGSTPGHPILFKDYSRHPHILNVALNSTAAGGYQMIFPTWSRIKTKIKAQDMTPPWQDRGAIELLSERGALEALADGDFTSALTRAAAEWASLPASTAGQHTQNIDLLTNYFKSVGGDIST
jgi:muramidase (phage lysozyme)